MQSQEDLYVGSPVRLLGNFGDNVQLTASGAEAKHSSAFRDWPALVWPRAEQVGCEPWPAESALELASKTPTTLFCYYHAYEGPAPSQLPRATTGCT